jgi:hypothetical protein
MFSLSQSLVADMTSNQTKTIEETAHVTSRQRKDRHVVLSGQAFSGTVWKAERKAKNAMDMIC